MQLLRAWPHLLQQIGDHEAEAATWDSIGYAHHQAGHHAQAAECYQRALAIYRDLDSRYEQAAILTHLGESYRSAGRPTAANTAWQQALKILADLDHPDANTIRAKLHDLDHLPIYHDQPSRTVRDIARMQLDRVSADRRRLVQAAAIVRRDFPARSLRLR